MVLLPVLWLAFMPSQLIPLPRWESQCVAVSASFMRILTVDCGVLVYRGTAPVVFGESYAMVRTGPVVWRVSDVDA